MLQASKKTQTAASGKASYQELATPTPAGRADPAQGFAEGGPDKGFQQTKPTTRAVTVIRSWAPDSMKDVRWVTASARFAEASPAAARALSGTGPRPCRRTTSSQ